MMISRRKQKELLIVVGGAGLSFAEYMIKEQENIETIDVLAIDSDEKGLQAIGTKNVIPITRTEIEDEGLNADTKRQLRKCTKYDNIYVVSGLGGSTNHIFPDVLEIVSENVYRHISVILYYCFEYESQIFQERAKETLFITKIFADELSVIYNQQLIENKDEPYDKVINRGHAIAMDTLKKSLMASCHNSCGAKVKRAKTVKDNIVAESQCPACHKIVAKGNLYCIYCGAKIKSTNE